MRVRDIMTGSPACCTPACSLRQIAQLMITFDCGVIPITEKAGSRQLLGIITDRDIACRCVARGLNPHDMKARDIMSSPVVTIGLHADVDECCRVMEEAMVRRLPVVDEAGDCCGIVSQADIAQRVEEHIAWEVVRDLSRPTGTRHGVTI